LLYFVTPRRFRYNRGGDRCGCCRHCDFRLKIASFVKLVETDAVDGNEAGNAISTSGKKFNLSLKRNRFK
jgi:hypothetical protein